MIRAIVPLVLAVALAAPARAQACGYHDPASIDLGALNLGLSGRAPCAHGRLDGAEGRRAPPSGTGAGRRPADGDDPRDDCAWVGPWRCSGRSGTGLPVPEGGRTVPSFSVILIGPMLWARFETRIGELALQAHADGPAQGDVIVVTDEPVIAALAEERITPQEARRLGLVRLYGARGSVEDVSSLLSTAPRARAIKAACRQHIVTKEAH